MRPALLGLDPATLAECLQGPGRARICFRSLAQGRDPFSDPDIPGGLRARLAQVAQPTAVHEARRTRAADGTTKFLLRLEAGDAVESVVIPELRRTTLCVSTQVGCARGCRFCRTGTMGLQRNLSVEEIVAQVHVGLRLAEEERLPPLRNIVFMGMGEPLDNWDAVRGALRSLVDPRGFGFGPRHVTVSTVAPSPRAVARLHGCSTRIAWSLHAAIDTTRKALVPTQRHSVEALRDAFTTLFASRKDPLFVEITLIEGLNDGPHDAEAALELFRAFPNEVRFNLLPMNAGPAAAYRPSGDHAVLAFEQTLRKAGHFAMVRAARGAEQSAACGQLAVVG